MSSLVPVPSKAHLRQHHRQSAPCPPPLIPLPPIPTEKPIDNCLLNISIEDINTNRTTNQNNPWKAKAQPNPPLQIGSKIRVEGTQDAGTITEIHRINNDDITFKAATANHLQPFWITVPRQCTRTTLLERWTHTAKQIYMNWRYPSYRLEEYPNFLTLDE